MNDDERQRARTRQLIEDCEKTIARCDAMVAQQRQAMAARGIDPAQLRREFEALGPAARRQVDEHVQKLMEEAERRGEEAAMHAQFNHGSLPPPRSRRLRNRV